MLTLISSHPAYNSKRKRHAMYVAYHRFKAHPLVLASGHLWPQSSARPQSYSLPGEQQSGQHPCVNVFNSFLTRTDQAPNFFIFSWIISGLQHISPPCAAGL